MLDGVGCGGLFPLRWSQAHGNRLPRLVAAQVTGSSAATRAAATSTRSLPCEPKMPLAGGLTETPGPCCRPAGLRPQGRYAGL